MLASSGLAPPPCGRAAPFPPAANNPPLPVAIPFLDRRFQPQLDQPQHSPIRNATIHRFEEVVMWNRIEVAGQIGIYDIGVAPAQMPVHILDCIYRPTSGTIAIRIVLEVGLEDRLQHELGGGLNDPIPDGRNAERT